MKFPRPQNLKQISDLINAEFVGQPDFEILGINEIHVVEHGDIVFVDHPKYYDKALESKASVVLINKEVDCPDGKALLISEDPFSDFNKITAHFSPFETSSQPLSKSAKIGKNTIIQPNVFIGNNVKIGDDCIIHSNVSIYDGVEIGNNVQIHAGTVLGADAFYYKNRPTHHDKLLSGGTIRINDNVEIGALCSIDKGVSGVTSIGEGTKIDNQVQVGHDTIIGKKCLIASQTGIAGCVVIEDEVTIWGQVGIASGLTIGKKVIILAQSGISKDLKSNITYFGTPADDIRKKYRELGYISRIPEIIQKLKNL
ncbi:UDP-3-O-(3-hydroxymyristoyl)glucosamine N-acyltransferase [Psychroflexus lacisalsi]|jgi:UDP-3-O-[3-hydroxymyristoyl] glucosamine N-acyltransferase|uniref:UDP-3-O-(3-hydroxymyristoyl)glucosamine N-acyltransferase n=1 Tax=Psychroflexus lacisalsi TaxID=503928 RepID=A0ABP3VHY7_9FLAO|nr:UDP-3-O-(3-hydroxymyristoyl)glucosamine N-acyltransferase [Psychroflexus lacisalsi]MBZ9619861.1 UDP-3-O-(3-hydroxymyristoyl)glucosamine N-acyltransferase [Psychroflexus lacisalsi]